MEYGAEPSENVDGGSVAGDVVIEAIGQGYNDGKADNVKDGSIVEIAQGFSMYLTCQ